jgi:hypothetical protein
LNTANWVICKEKLFSHSSGGWKPKVKVQAFGEGLLGGTSRGGGHHIMGSLFLFFLFL